MTDTTRSGDGLDPSLIRREGDDNQSIWVEGYGNEAMLDFMEIMLEHDRAATTRNIERSTKIAKAFKVKS